MTSQPWVVTRAQAAPDGHRAWWRAVRSRESGELLGYVERVTEIGRGGGHSILWDSFSPDGDPVTEATCWKSAACHALWKRSTAPVPEAGA